MQEIVLKNADIEAIVLPHIGGRLVSLRKNGGENILKSDRSQWNEEKPSLDAFSDFKAYNGHTTWVGPQCDWWIKQDENIQRKKERSMWPPDPFLIYGEYEIEKRTESSVVLKSPESKFSQIQFLKEYAINPDGSIYINVIMFNYSNNDISWDIWFNTRLNGYCKSYVPLTNNDSDIKIEHVLSTNSTEMPFTTDSEFFSYNPTEPPQEFGERSSKTFIYPSKPYIAGFTDRHMLMIQFEKHPKNTIHDEQALVEIYNHTEHKAEAALLELEYHSPYFHLKPGEVAEAYQVWNIYEYTGENNRKSHIDFLRSKEISGEI